MAINLLPSEEKAKIKKERELVSPRIELTGPLPGERTGEGKPVKHTAGVLSFFQGAFRRPKKEAEESAPARQMPEKKILLTEKITYVKQRPSPRPTVTYVAQKQITAAKKQAQPGGSWWSRLFGKKEAAPAAVEHAPVPVGPASQFPKYSSVRAEKVAPAALPRKPRNGEVVHVVTRREPPAESHAPVEPKRFIYTKDGFPVVEPALHAMLESRVPVLIPAPKRATGWQRFVAWLKRIFGSKKKVPPVMPPAPTAPEKPRTPELFRAQTEVRMPMPPAPPAQEHPVQRVPVSVPTPAPRVPPAVKPLPPISTPPPFHTIPAIQKQAAQRIVVPPPPPPPAPAKPAVIKPPVHILPPLSNIRPQSVIAAQKKENWLERLWKRIKAFFSKRAHVSAHPQMPLTAGQPIAERALAPERLAPPPPPAPSGAGEKNLVGARAAANPVLPVTGEKHQVSDARDRMRVSPLLRQKKGDGSISLTQPADASLRVQPFDWEVNLVPEEIVEQEIPISKVLYLVLFVIVTCALVYGGWLWTNFYHNNITTQISEIESKIQSKETEITKHSRIQDDVNLFNARVAGIRKLLANHVYWSQIFTKLEQNTISDVYLTALTVDVNGTVQITAVGKTYESAIKQLYVFQRASDFVKSATISLIQFQKDGGNASEEIQSGSDRPVLFTVDLAIYPTIFYSPR